MRVKKLSKKIYPAPVFIHTLAIPRADENCSAFRTEDENTSRVEFAADCEAPSLSFGPRGTAMRRAPTTATSPKRENNGCEFANEGRVRMARPLKLNFACTVLLLAGSGASRERYNNP